MLGCRLVVLCLGLWLPLVPASDVHPPPTPLSLAANLGNVTLARDDLHLNIAINQLALLQLLNESKRSSEKPRDMCELDEIRRLQDALHSLRDDLANTLRENTDTVRADVTKMHTQLASLIEENLQGLESKEHQEDYVTSLQQEIAKLQDNQTVQQQELAILRQQINSLQNDIILRDSGRDTLEREVQQLREDLEALNRSKTLTVEEHETTTSGAVPLNCSEDRYIVSDNCSIIHRHNHGHRAENNVVPTVSISDLLAKNCIYLDKSNKDWESARASCRQLGGDLFVAGDLQGMISYLRSINWDNWTWVGIRSRTWINGRPVLETEWREGQPNREPTACAELKFRVNGVDDEPCTTTRPSLCQIGVSYS